MISEDIMLDKLISDIDQQIDILIAIGTETPILQEQLRLLNESRELLVLQDLEMHRLVDLLGPDGMQDHATIIDRLAHVDDVSGH